MLSTGSGDLHASDQAERIAAELACAELRGVSAGLYIGGKGSHGVSGPKHLVDDRDVLRKSPPDILLTNYRMLDYLLMRPADSKLWAQNQASTLRYLVLDELHTYDGAQGSDVACLVRRLKDRLGTPDGHLCCVGTSATIGGTGGEDPRRPLVEFAEQVFGEPFELDGCVGEDRLSLAEALPEEVSGEEMPFGAGAPGAGFEALEPERYRDDRAYLAAQANLWLGHGGAYRVMLAEELAGHRFLRWLLGALVGRDGRGGPRSWTELADEIGRLDADFADQSREHQWLVLASFLSLLAHARTHDSGRERPFLHVQVQLWIRELTGLVRKVDATEFAFAWRDELKHGPNEHWLPIVYCDECGLGGLGATQLPGQARLRDNPQEIGRAYLNSADNARFVYLGRSAEPAVGPKGQQLEIQNYLCPRCLTVDAAELCGCALPEVVKIPTLIQASLSEKHRFLRHCPRCGNDGTLSMLGSRAASLSSVALSRLYLSPFNDDHKLLAFTDSVQDASHRAGFFAARTFRFTMRTAIQTTLEASEGNISLAGFFPRMWDHWKGVLGEAKAAATLLPPDLREDPAYVHYRDADRPTQHHRNALERLLRDRLSWEVTQEYGLTVTRGRSLDRTGCSTVAVPGPLLDEAAAALTAFLVQEKPVLSKPGLPPGAVRHYLEGLTQRLRLRGGIHHPLLLRYAQTGNPYELTKKRNPRLSRFGRGSVLPRFLFSGDQHKTFDPLFSKPTTYTWLRDWTARALNLEAQDGGINSVVERAVRYLGRAGVIETLAGRAAETSGLRLEALQVIKTVTAVRCPECGRVDTVACADRIVGHRCFAYRCTGRYEASAGFEGESTYYRDLYKSGRVERIFSGEHTGLLKREVREQLERDFKQRPKPDSPNLLTCTPTLEMGIDIGDLSAVMLCAVPPTPANYIQRVGRAGRSTGNALVLTMVNARPHDLYFDASPVEMLRGQIVPPGCFLDAPEMLTRQMLAHAMDQWALQETTHQIPHEVRLIKRKKLEGFPYCFYSFYVASESRLTERFLELFSGHVTPGNATHLRDLAANGRLLERMKEAFAAVDRERESHRDKLKKLDLRRRALEEKPDTFTVDPEDPERSAEDEIKEINDARYAYIRLREALDKKHPLNVLTDAGVLPNYAFPEPGVTLSALLRGPKGDGAEPAKAGAKPEWQRHQFEYTRAASSAIREFAPFNTFYAEGHKVQVSQIDLGTKARSLLETWRLCPSCHHMERILDSGAPSGPCPQCASVHYGDQGQKRQLVHFRRAWSSMELMDASTADDSEEREIESYHLGELIDVQPEHCAGARLIESPELVFGYELLRGLTLRQINFGRQRDVGLGTDFAGDKVMQRGFRVCVNCGKVSGDMRNEHTPYCRVRTAAAKEEFEEVFLYREMSSEAIRVLLPVSGHHVEALGASIRAALQLGFRKKFKGRPTHLRITTAAEPRDGVTRHFLVIYDEVPGGTGYLAELWRSDAFLDVIQLSLDAMRTCPCAAEEDRDGCYRCLYAYQSSHDIPQISRREAVTLFERVVLARGQMKVAPTLSKVAVDEVLESELEQRFVDVLRRHAEHEQWGFTATLNGGKTCWLLTTPNSAWLLEPQRSLGPSDGVALHTRPDFIATCTSRSGMRPVAIFCDGLEYHVCPGAERSRLGDDLHKRRAILDSERFYVWSVTWKDVVDFDESGARAGTTTLFADAGEQRMRDLCARLEWSVPIKRRHMGSMALLVELLASADLEAWERLPRVLGFGALAVPPRHHAPDGISRLAVELAGRATRFSAVLEGGPSAPTRLGGLEARAWASLLAEVPSPSLQKGDLTALHFTLRLFDEPDACAAQDFEESWRAFLHAWNLLQFHSVEQLTVVSSQWLSEGGDGENEPARDSAKDALGSRLEVERLRETEP